MPFNHNFWNQINKNKFVHKPLKEAYNNVLLRQSISRIKQFCLVEEYDLIAERVGLNKMVGVQLAKTMRGWREGGVKNGAIRLQPADTKNPPILTDQAVKDAVESLGYKFVAKHIPGSFGSAKGEKNKSSKFPTYELEAEGLPVYVVFGVGGNKGNEFEKKANEEMAAMKGEHPILKPLVPLIAPDTIASVTTRAGSTRRSFTGRVDDVGQIIADTWVIGESGKTYFVSLKNTGGATISNHGCGGIFKSWDTEGKLSFDANAFPPLTNLFNKLNVDVNLLINNLQQYINAMQGREWTPSTVTDTVSNGDLNAFKEAVMSSIGYGYYYAREKSGGKIQFEDLTTVEKLSEFIGNIQKVEIRYPYVKGLGLREKRKGLDLIGQTSKGWRFIFQFRNAGGGLIPRQLNLMIAGNGSPEPVTQEA
jgi:hypothetical protein